MPEGTIPPPNYPDPIRNNVNMLPDQMVGTLKPDNTGQLQPAPYLTEEPDPTATATATAEPEVEPEVEPEDEEKKGLLATAVSKVASLVTSSDEEPKEEPASEEPPAEATAEEVTAEPAVKEPSEEPSEEPAAWSDGVTVTELKAVAKEEGIKGYGNMNQGQLIEAIETKRAESADES